MKCFMAVQDHLSPEMRDPWEEQPKYGWRVYVAIAVIGVVLMLLHKWSEQPPRK